MKNHSSLKINMKNNIMSLYCKYLIIYLYSTSFITLLIDSMSIGYDHNQYVYLLTFISLQCIDNWIHFVLMDGTMKTILVDHHSLIVEQQQKKLFYYSKMEKTVDVSTLGESLSRQKSEREFEIFPRL